MNTLELTENMRVILRNGREYNVKGDILLSIGKPFEEISLKDYNVFMESLRISAAYDIMRVIVVGDITKSTFSQPYKIIWRRT